VAKMPEICYSSEMLRDLANRWFQPLTHVSDGGFPRVSATYVNRETRDTRCSGRFAVSQPAAHSVRGKFFGPCLYGGE
jgi:hypothetical protein